MKVAVVPGVRALLPAYASLHDPVAELRAACLEAVRGLGPRVRVVAVSAGSTQVAEALVSAVGASRVEDEETGVLLVGNGSARRTDKAPGHFDARAEAFDDQVRGALLAGDPTEPGVDGHLAEELWAETAAFGALPDLVEPGAAAEVLYDDAPYGVQYWVMRWR